MRQAKAYPTILPEETWTGLEAEAKRAGRSMSWLLGHAWSTHCAEVRAFDAGSYEVVTFRDGRATQRGLQDRRVYIEQSVATEIEDAARRLDLTFHEVVELCFRRAMVRLQTSDLRAPAP